MSGKSVFLKYLFVVGLSSVVIACEGPTSSPDSELSGHPVVDSSDGPVAPDYSCTEEEIKLIADEKYSQLWNKLIALEKTYGFSLMLGSLGTPDLNNTFYLAENGALSIEEIRDFEFHLSPSSAYKVYQSASTAKLVSASVILKIVGDQIGGLTLDSLAKDYIPLDLWPDVSESSPLNNIKLRHLLNFTSGLNLSAGDCLYDSQNTDIQTCVKDILESNKSSQNEPGQSFYYSPNHLQVAGLMAIRALNLGSANPGSSSESSKTTPTSMDLTSIYNWSLVFEDFKNTTVGSDQVRLFNSSLYNYPSSSSPLLAGGMDWTASEYYEFLKALAQDFVKAHVNQMNLNNQVPLTWQNRIFTESFAVDLALESELDKRATEILNYPVQSAMNKDWKYGYGFWFECLQSHVSDPECRNYEMISSPAAWGAYPFVNIKKGYFGIIALEKRDGSISDRLYGNMKTGYEIFQQVKADIEEWNRSPRVECEARKGNVTVEVITFDK